MAVLTDAFFTLLVDFFTADLGLLTTTVVEVLGHVQASSQIGQRVASRSNDAVAAEVLGLLLPIEAVFPDDFLVFLLAEGEGPAVKTGLLLVLLLLWNVGAAAGFLLTVMPVSKISYSYIIAPNSTKTITFNLDRLR